MTATPQPRCTRHLDEPPQHDPACLMPKWDHFASFACPLPPSAGGES